MRCRSIAVSQETNPDVWGAIGHSSSIPWGYVVQAVDPFAKAARALSTLMSAETREELITIYDDLRCYTGTTDLTPAHRQTFDELGDLNAARIRDCCRRLYRTLLPDRQCRRTGSLDAESATPLGPISKGQAIADNVHYVN